MPPRIETLGLIPAAVTRLFCALATTLRAASTCTVLTIHAVRPQITTRPDKNRGRTARENSLTWYRDRTNVVNRPAHR